MNRAFLVIAGLTAVSLAGCDAPIDEHIVGTLERDRIDITAETNEPIVERAVRDGDPVTAGTLLFRQDPARAEARRAQAAAQRDQAAARLAELQRGPRAERIAETRARLDAARAEADNLRAELTRVQGVFERGLASESALERARTAWAAADAAARAVGETLEAQLEGTTVEELDQAVAALEAAEALLAQADLDVDRTEHRAPVDGVLDKMLYQVGERPAPGTTVAVLLDDARVYARVYVPEHLKARVRPGQSLAVRIDGVDREFAGTVRWVSADANFTPYFALTEHDRSRLSYLAEIDVPDAGALPTGVPLEVLPPRADAAAE